MIKSVFGSDWHGATWACSPPGLCCRLTVSEQALRQRVIWLTMAATMHPASRHALTAALNLAWWTAPASPPLPTL